METILNHLNKDVLLVLISSLSTGVVFFIVRFFNEQKDKDRELLAAINGLGERVNRELSGLRRDVLQIEKRIIILSHEFELKALKSETKPD